MEALLSNRTQSHMRVLCNHPRQFSVCAAVPRPTAARSARGRGGSSCGVPELPGLERESAGIVTPKERLTPIHSIGASERSVFSRPLRSAGTTSLCGPIDCGADVGGHQLNVQFEGVLPQGRSYRPRSSRDYPATPRNVPPRLGDEWGEGRHHSR